MCSTQSSKSVWGWILLNYLLQWTNFPLVLMLKVSDSSLHRANFSLPLLFPDICYCVMRHAQKKQELDQANMMSPLISNGPFLGSVITQTGTEGLRALMDNLLARRWAAFVYLPSEWFAERHPCKGHQGTRGADTPRLSTLTWLSAQSAPSLPASCTVLVDWAERQEHCRADKDVF